MLRRPVLTLSSVSAVSPQEMRSEGRMAKASKEGLEGRKMPIHTGSRKAQHRRIDGVHNIPQLLYLVYPSLSYSILVLLVYPILS